MFEAEEVWVLFVYSVGRRERELEELTAHSSFFSRVSGIPSGVSYPLTRSLIRRETRVDVIELELKQDYHYWYKTRTVTGQAYTGARARNPGPSRQDT